MQRRWWLLLFLGTLAAIVALIIAIFVGELLSIRFNLPKYGQQLIQATVMSAIMIPIIFRLYKYFRVHYDMDEQAYAIIKMPHFFLGFFLVSLLTTVSLFIWQSLGWITLTNWNHPSTWIGALLLNMLIAFFYEALPEELAIRGFIYDVLRLRLSMWKTIFAQAVIFIIFSASVTILLVLINLSSVETLIALPSQLIFHFFFAIALGIVRAKTGSLWAAIGFHLGYLILVRFVVMPNEYGAPAIVTFNDHIETGVGSVLTIMFIIFGSIIIMTLFKRKN